jgi:hypothetical protein
LNFLEIPNTGDLRETVALDYKYGEKAYPEYLHKGEDKKYVNAYEVGGGQNLTRLLSAPLNS